MKTEGAAVEIDSIPVIEPEIELKYTPAYGMISASAGGIAGQGLIQGVKACLSGITKALVTAPSCKEALHLAGYRYPGQTEMIAALAEAPHFIMILATGDLRIGLATTHTAVRDIRNLIREDLIVEKIANLRNALSALWGIQNPKIAVTALNPHASDGGIFGDEEKEIISPAIHRAQMTGAAVEGPFPADTLFPRWQAFDGILAMYHDQGMIPIKMAGFGEAINTTGGLPFPRTSPDHGTAFDIAGQLKANHRSMLRAIEAAATFVDLGSSNK